MILCQHIILSSGFLVPHDSGIVGLDNTLPIIKANAQSVLSIVIALFCGFTVPKYRIIERLCYPKSFVITSSKEVLSSRISLLGRFLEPNHGSVV